MIEGSLGAGDSCLLTNVLPEKFLSEHAFDAIAAEVAWREQVNKGGKVPRLLSYQGVVTDQGHVPVYRVPSDEPFTTMPMTPLVNEIRIFVEAAIGQSFNHCLVQLYRSGCDFISEHSDKTLDISRGTCIVNLSLGSERVMRLRSKPDFRKEKETINVRLPHNSLFVLGWETNRGYMHEIRPDKREESQKTPEERMFGGRRISFTFRSIATFVRADGRVFGQGALHKTEGDLENALADGNYDLSRSSENQSVDILRAFSHENHFSNFDWDSHYGAGFNVLRICMGDSEHQK